MYAVKIQELFEYPPSSLVTVKIAVLAIDDSIWLTNSDSQVLDNASVYCHIHKPSAGKAYAPRIMYNGQPVM